MLLRIHICGHNKSDPYGCWRFAIMLLTVCDNVANTHEMGCEHSVRRRGPIHRARILTLSNTHFRITKYVHSHHRTHISVCHFVGVSIYAGTINRPLRLLTVCHFAANGLPKHCWRIAIMQRTHHEKSTNTNEIHTKNSTKLVANIPSGVGSDSSCPYPNIIKYTYSRHQIRVSVSPHTHIHIIKNVYSHYQICTFTSSHTHFHITKYVYSHYWIRIFISPNMCIHIIARTFLHYQICVFTLLNTYIHFTEYVHLHYRTRISILSHTHIRPPFRGCFRICGHDK